MAKTEKVIAKITESRIQLAITLAGVVVVLAGLWLTSRLSPIVQDVSINAVNIENNKEMNILILDRLISIEEKIDNYILTGR